MRPTSLLSSLRVSPLFFSILAAGGAFAACGSDDDAPSSPQGDAGANDAQTSNDSNAADDAGDPSTACDIAVDAPAPALGDAEMFRHEDVRVGGKQADRYVWRDSKNLVRSVAIKKQCAANSGNGGYAIAATYVADGVTRTVSADDSEDTGFGYFVAHEIERTFDDQTTGTIAALHSEDDSPLGKGFRITSSVSAADATKGSHTTLQPYPKWGSIDAIAHVYDDQGNDSSRVPKDLSKHAKYMLPVTTRWAFAAGTDAPNIEISIDLAGLPGPDRVNFDVRGPYGILNPEGSNAALATFSFADYYLFQNATKNGQVAADVAASWDWTVATPGSRFAAFQSTDGWEFGLYEPLPIAATRIASGYTNARAKTSATGGSCADPVSGLPCVWELPYQLFGYGGIYAGGPTTHRKLTWGSAAFYGSSLTAIYDGTATRTIDAFPASKKIAYSVCWVLAKANAAGSSVTSTSPTCPAPTL